MKICNRCHKELFEGCFTKNKHCSDRLEPFCRLCSRFKNYQRMYGLSKEHYYSLLRAQNNRCPICDTILTLTNMEVDHCHITKKIRGLLCWDCNRLLGHAKDSSTILIKAIRYLYPTIQNDVLFYDI